MKAKKKEKEKKGKAERRKVYQKRKKKRRIIIKNGREIGCGTEEKWQRKRKTKEKMCYKDNKSDTEKKELNKKKKCGEEVK